VAVRFFLLRACVQLLGFLQVAAMRIGKHPRERNIYFPGLSYRLFIHRRL
jgi:hypothetical protein